MYIQMHAKIAAGVEFQESLVKVEDVALMILFLARNGAFISQAQKVWNWPKFFILKQFPIDRYESWFITPLHKILQFYQIS